VWQDVCSEKKRVCGEWCAVRWKGCDDGGRLHVAVFVLLDYKCCKGAGLGMSGMRGRGTITPPNWTNG
jgi:hypothetical protein